MNKLFEFCQKLNGLIAQNHQIICGQWLGYKSIIARKFVTDGVGVWVFGESPYIVAEASDVWIHNLTRGEYVHNIPAHAKMGIVQDDALSPSSNNRLEPSDQEEHETKRGVNCSSQPPSTTVEELDDQVSAKSSPPHVKKSNVPENLQDGFFWQGLQRAVEKSVREEFERLFVRML